MSTNCTEFRAHHLRPDKCKNCFGDKSRHQQLNIATSEYQQQQRQQEKSDKIQDKGENKNASSANELSREQLVIELKKCHEERTKLADGNKRVKSEAEEKSQMVESYKKEIERLRFELSKAGRESESDSKRNEVTLDSTPIKCDKCGLSQSAELKQLMSELELFKNKWKSAEAEKEQARDELRSLEREMEEMHDNFREEESEQFEQLKQELDLAMKNCKILQIRLNKSERQYGQLEQVKSMLEHQLEECNSRRQEPEKTTLASSFTQIGPDSVKLSTCEYDQLLRDLNDIIEREKDLQEQIKYSQEEAQLKSDRLQAVEAENEVLMSRVNKLTLTISKLRSNQLKSLSSMDRNESASDKSQWENGRGETFDLIQQNEQLKLALDLVQSECERLKSKWQDSLSLLDTKENCLRECEKTRKKLEGEIGIRVKTSNRPNSSTIGFSGNDNDSNTGDQVTRLEFECRQLRTRLVHSEREGKQLKAQLEMNTSGRQLRTGENSARMSLGSSMKSQSMELAGEQARNRELDRQLKEQCDSLRSQNVELERKVERLIVERNVGQTRMESDLLDKLKRQLDTSESELAKARSRLVELDVECGRVQRQYKRLVESLESGDENQLGCKVKLPAESLRDSMSRQELRQAIKDLEEEVEECATIIRAKNCLLREQSSQREACETPTDGLYNKSASTMTMTTTTTTTATTSEEQLKSLRRLLDQERLLSNNLKIDVANLEQAKLELYTSNRMLERERKVMEEELEKLRQVNNDLNLNLEEVKQSERSVSNKLKEFQISCEKMRTELAQSRSSAGSQSSTPRAQVEESQSVKSFGGQSGEILLLTRDLSELKVKNGFLMRQLEIAREDTGRQLDDMRQANEAQQRRAVEVAQLELKERQLVESQQLRDELNELKQKLVACQRQAARNEEEASGERDRLRSVERDWRRDKSQWQQRLEQLEAQSAIERRSHEFKVKESELLVREKERELMGIQDRYVQLERDLKRTQNKYNLLEENSESKHKKLIRDLETKKRELSELLVNNQTREEEYYKNCKRFNNEKATLLEALESIKRSYDEKLAELKSIRELLLLRQDQSYKERSSAQETIDNLSSQLIKMSEHETQAKLLRQQLQMQEKQLDSLKKDQLQLKEERVKLKTRCDDLERRCQHYEKQELITKTTNISSSTNSFLRTRNPFYSSKESGKKQSDLSLVRATKQQETEENGQQSQIDRKNQCLMTEKLTSKINDQRHLINMLKQQHGETQMELKQLKLLHSSEISKWQSRIAQLTSRLNECEERLLFESSLVSQVTFESSRRKLEVKWTEERQATLDMVKQQQVQNELLIRDFKKLSQSHDMLRLQSKQLEAHNNKLSRKLIEYEQQQEHRQHRAATVESFAKRSGNETGNLGHKLEACLSEKKDLVARQAQLVRVNTKLMNIMKEEARPLIATVSKIVSSLENGADQNSLKQSSETATEQQKASLQSSGFSLVSSNETKPNSTNRPLMTTGKRQQQQSDDETSIGHDLISSAQPAHRLASQQQQSRLSRLLCTQPKDNALEPNEKVKSTQVPKSTKTTKRVKVKSSSLGITTAEKKHLKQHLQVLSVALDELGADASIQIGDPRNEGHYSSMKLHTSSQSADRGKLSAVDQPKGGASGVASRKEPSHSYEKSESPESRVHWQADSDLDSEKSWSMSQIEKSQRADVYRRFPESKPASYGGGTSLTDCDSECSLASDFSSYSSQPRFVSGTESDSCVQTVIGGQHKLKGNRKRGLRLRLTSTLRNISRSISGLASDSEAESNWPSKREQKTMATKTSSKEGGEHGLREIRV